MFSLILLSGLFASVKAQIPIPQNNAGPVHQVNDPSNPGAQQQQQAWAPPPAVGAVPPPPLLASEFIHSGQLPTYNPGYISNAHGYFVPVYVDAEEELPEEFAQKLVDPSQLDTLLKGAPVAVPAWDPNTQQQQQTS